MAWKRINWNKMKLKEVDSLTDRELEILRLISEGSSDREISQKLYLSINTVKWHNRQIYAKLGVTNRGQAAAVAAENGLLEEKHDVEKPTLRIKKHNLPAQISSFIGRKTEIDQIIGLLKSNRLLTLTGPGGVGKTRLALQVAAVLIDEEIFEDGIYFVELAVVSNPERIGKAIFDVLGLQAGPKQPVDQTLKDYLETRTLLLGLDNFEHLLEGIGTVRELLESASHLSILCTSREALQLGGEQIFPILPLKRDPSQELFIQRARKVKNNFKSSEEDLPLIDQICARLDRLPLAIELAAARMNIFSLQSLLDKMENRLHILTESPRDAPARHQTLQDAIDWSFDLLEEEEQILFRRLAVFQGSRSIDAVEAVCCYDLNLYVLDGLGSLLAKNLIRQELGFDGEPRFYLLETVHEYTRKKLRTSGDGEEIRLRHAEFYVALAEEARYPSRGGPNQIRWLKRLEADHDNLRVIYESSMNEGEVELALRLVGCLDYFWLRMGSFDEAILWTTQSLNFIEDVPPVIQAGIYGVAGMVFYVVKMDRELSKKMYRKALNIYQDLGDIREMGWIHIHIMDPCEMFVAERDELMDHFEKGVELLKEVDDQVGIAQALTTLGVHEHCSMNRKAARRAFQKGLDIAHKAGDSIRENICLNNLACVQYREGNAEIAQDMYKEVLKMGVAIGRSVYLEAGTLSYMAGTAVDLGEPKRSIILHGAADMLFKTGGHKPQPPQVPYFKESYNKACSQLDKITCQNAWAAGQSMTPEEAIAYALEEDDPA